MMRSRIDPELKKIVLWRIETSIPKHFKLSMGNKGSYNKEELKRHVEQEDDVGLEIVNMQLKFMKAVSSGEFTKILAESD